MTRNIMIGNGNRERDMRKALGAYIPSVIVIIILDYQDEWEYLHKRIWPIAKVDGRQWKRVSIGAMSPIHAWHVLRISKRTLTRYPMATVRMVREGYEIGEECEAQIAVGNEHITLYPMIRRRLKIFHFPTYDTFVSSRVESGAISLIICSVLFSVDAFIRLKGGTRISRFKSAKYGNGVIVEVFMVLSEIAWYRIVCNGKAEIKKLYTYLWDHFWDSTLPSP